LRLRAAALALRGPPTMSQLRNIGGHRPPLQLLRIMIQIMKDLFIPEDEVSFTASRSSGPGGQNVNKLNTKVTLSFDVGGSAALSDEEKRLIRAHLASRINNEGILQVISQRTRSQELNRADALKRFSELLHRALTPRRPRIASKVPSLAKQQRLDKKRKRGLTKQGRTRKGWDS
jgi:ribosome-associated protein